MTRLLPAALLLAACGADPAARLEPPPEAVTEPCAAPTTWQRGQALTQQEVEVLWGRDRAALRDCGDRHELLARWAQGQVGVSD